MASFALATATAAWGCTYALPRAGGIDRPGFYERRMEEEVAGYHRLYKLYVPEECLGPEPCSLVVAVHGGFTSASQFAEVTGFTSLSEREKFLIVYPTGTGLFGYRHFWNSGHCCGPALAGDSDDVEFLAQVIEDVQGRVAVKKGGIFLVGHSNGGMLAHRYASERTESLAAVAVVAGTIGGTAATGADPYRVPSPGRPLPVLILHGTSDEQVAYDGGRATRTRGSRSDVGAMDSAVFWAEHNRCTEGPFEETERGGYLVRRSWRGCKDHVGVVLDTLVGWGHVWPGPIFTSGISPNSPWAGFDAAERIWAFFRVYAEKQPRSNP